MEASLRMDFGVIRPKIAVLGINPHCGDQGVIGNEEEKIIHPVVQKLYKEGIFSIWHFIVLIASLYLTTSTLMRL